jgi:hypothetical protein
MAKAVMIVEDNERNMKLFRDLLEAYGYRTVGTRNGWRCSISPASGGWIFSYQRSPVSK